MSQLINSFTELSLILKNHATQSYIDKITVFCLKNVMSISLKEKIIASYNIKNKSYVYYVIVYN